MFTLSLMNRAIQGDWAKPGEGKNKISSGHDKIILMDQIGPTS